MFVDLKTVYETKSRQHRKEECSNISTGFYVVHLKCSVKKTENVPHLLVFLIPDDHLLAILQASGEKICLIFLKKIFYDKEDNKNVKKTVDET